MAGEGHCREQASPRPGLPPQLSTERAAQASPGRVDGTLGHPVQAWSSMPPATRKNLLDLAHVICYGILASHWGFVM